MLSTETRSVINRRIYIYNIIYNDNNNMERAQGRDGVGSIVVVIFLAH